MAIKERATSHYLSDNNHDITSLAAGAGRGQARAGARLQEPLLVPASAGHECWPAWPALPPHRRSAGPRHLAPRHTPGVRKITKRGILMFFLILSSAISPPACGSNQASKGMFK